MGKKKPKPLVTSPAMAPALAPPDRSVRLDLACGQKAREGFEGVDLYAPGAQRVDLCKFPWPWADSSVDELHCSHFVEHIPNREIYVSDVTDAGTVDFCEAFIGRDMFLAFFDEAYRVLKKGGRMTVIVPALQTSRAFQDPTHRRYIPQETFLYLNRKWREHMKLDHYPVACDFEVGVIHTLPTEHTAFHEEVVRRRFFGEWNFILDFHATLVALKP